MGATYEITGVRPMWETAYAGTYEIQTSTDGTTWTTQHSTTAGSGGVELIDNLTATARYVRLYGRARGTTYGYSLWDFEVYGTAVG